MNSKLGIVLRPNATMLFDYFLSRLFF